MNTTDHIHRIGKIARLPVDIRTELNHRLLNNEPAETILCWVNQHPKATAMLAKLFDGRPISQQNLSAWKLGGFRDWERHQRTRALARDFLEEAEELENEVWTDTNEGRRSILDRVSDRMAVALLQLFREAEESEPGPTRTKTMLEIMREMTQLRRVDQVRQRTAMLQERWQAEQQAEEERQGREIMRREKLRILMTYDEAAEHYREYIDGLARGTISEKSQKFIREFFARNADVLDDFKLPEGEELEARVAKKRENLRQDGELPPKEVEEENDDLEEVENSGETSLHKAAQGNTRQENFPVHETNRGSDARHSAPSSVADVASV